MGWVDINQKIVEYIKYYSNQGHSIDKIRRFLIANNTPQKDVDEAIEFINKSHQTVLATNPALEMQIKNYIQTQLRNGYAIEIIKNSLQTFEGLLAT